MASQAGAGSWRNTNSSVPRPDRNSSFEEKTKVLEQALNNIIATGHGPSRGNRRGRGRRPNRAPPQHNIHSQNPFALERALNEEKALDNRSRGRGHGTGRRGRGNNKQPTSAFTTNAAFLIDPMNISLPPINARSLGRSSLVASADAMVPSPPTASANPFGGSSSDIDLHPMPLANARVLSTSQPVRTPSSVFSGDHMSGSPRPTPARPFGNRQSFATIDAKISEPPRLASASSSFGVPYNPFLASSGASNSALSSAKSHSFAPGPSAFGGSQAQKNNNTSKTFGTPSHPFTTANVADAPLGSQAKTLVGFPASRNAVSGRTFGAPSDPFTSSYTADAPLKSQAKPFGGFPAQTNSAPDRTFGAPSNPFTSSSTTDTLLKSPVKPFGGFPAQTNGAPDKTFGAPSNPLTSSSTTDAPLKSQANPFVGFPAPTTSTSRRAFGTPSTSFPPAAPKSGGGTNGLTTNSTSTAAFPADNSSNSPTSNNLAPTATILESQSDSFRPSPADNADSQALRETSLTASAAKDTITIKIETLLLKEALDPPVWPTTNPGDPQQKNAVEKHWRVWKAYRKQVRKALIRAGLLDDPDKPKNLSDAIPFKGICEEMCPEFEKVTRIMDHSVQDAEKFRAPNGERWPFPPKMIKALARSAAGQDAPLPMDVRSPAALRKTLDYLLHTVLAESETGLPNVHGFLWDRTRAIRRDFIFQSSMSSRELVDQVYCLERITRFHVIALHQMSKTNNQAPEFSEQQEIEQLGKSLLSLIHTYDDCENQNLNCPNESEFRAYYIMFNSHNPGIMETIQDWQYKPWYNSLDIQIATNLVEALQNTWDYHGPLSPETATNVAENSFARFFSIVEDFNVSYTMACFAEIHFNNVRKSALKAIYAAYRLQRPRTKDWTLDTLNETMRFDSESELVSFFNAYSAHLTVFDGKPYMSFESDVSDPFPPLKQSHSYFLVERKRGTATLPEAMDKTIFGMIDDLTEEVGQPGLFVPDDRASISRGASTSQTTITTTISGANGASVQEMTKGEQSSSTTETSSNPKRSIFDRVSLGPATESPSLTTSADPTPETLGNETSLDNFIPPKPSGIAPSFFGSPPSQPNGQPQPTFSFVQPSSNLPAQSLGPSAAAFPSGFANPGLGFMPPTQLGSHAASDTASVAATPPSVIPLPQTELGSHFVSAAPLAVPNPSSFLGTQPVSISRQQPTNATATDKNSWLDTPRTSTILPVPQLSSGTAMNPQESSILKSQTSFEAPNGPIAEAALSPTPPANATDSTDPRMQRVAEWVFNGPGCQGDIITEDMVKELCWNVWTLHETEVALKAQMEAEERARFEADEFRYHFLATKYSRKWRTLAKWMWQKRRGRQAREERKKLLESRRYSTLALPVTDVVKDSRASTQLSRRPSLESLLEATGVLDGVHNADEEIQAIVRGSPTKSSKRRPATKDLIRSTSTKSSKKQQTTEDHLGGTPAKYSKKRTATETPATSPNSTGAHKRTKSDNPLRRSLLSDPVFISGESAIHRLPDSATMGRAVKRASGVKTDYFRLKARGITTLPDGTPLASSVVDSLLREKRSYEKLTQASTSTPDRRQETPRSAPQYPSIRQDGLRTTVEREEDIEVLKARARKVMAKDHGSRQVRVRRSFEIDDQDEELFARARRIREQMDEGAGWYRKHLRKSGTESRSRS